MYVLNARLSYIQYFLIIYIADGFFTEWNEWGNCYFAGGDEAKVKECRLKDKMYLRKRNKTCKNFDDHLNYGKVSCDKTYLYEEEQEQTEPCDLKICTGMPQ